MKKLYFVLLMGVVCAGCGKSESSTSSGPAIAHSTDITSLNTLAGAGTNTLNIQFNTVNSVNLDLFTGNTPVSNCAAIGTCECANGESCNCPYVPACAPIPTPPESRATIFGSGALIDPQSGNTVVSDLQMIVTFDPSIAANGEACLDLADDALLNGLQLNIQATFVIVPTMGSQTGSGTASGSSAGSTAVPPTAAMAGDPTAIGQLVTTAQNVSQGLSSPPTFSEPWAGLILSTIISCAEGEPSPIPSPLPEPLPIYIPVDGVAN